ncbi:hypothetical protein ACFYSC_32820 [Streptosporangium sp. NPDC004379]|uniref:hypothetical protein n=1 Tax=Streptosporangium sp. NPDC004379 TaxID=3366189 RepID=UPI0036A060E5
MLQQHPHGDPRVQPEPGQMVRRRGVQTDPALGTDEMCARLSPIQYDHINFLGRYAFSRADVAGGLRPFHDGAQASA